MWRVDVHAPTSRFLTGTQQNGGATAANCAPITKKNINTQDYRDNNHDTPVINSAIATGRPLTLMILT